MMTQAYDGLSLAYRFKSITENYQIDAEEAMDWAMDWSRSDEEYMHGPSYDDGGEGVATDAGHPMARVGRSGGGTSPLPINSRWHNLRRGIPTKHAKDVRATAQAWQKRPDLVNVRMNEGLRDPRGRPIRDPETGSLLRPDVQAWDKARQYSYMSAA